MEGKIYNSKGKEAGKIKLPESVFGLPLKTDLIHQVVYSILSNKRRPIAHTKGRSEKRGGGRKPWRQKGTGNARHGSIRSPLWAGGGVTFGPNKERNFSKKVNKKMKKKALFSLLSEKNRRGQIIFVDDIDITEAKTKEAKDILANLSKVKGYEDLLSRRNNSAILALDSKKPQTEKSFRNFGNLTIRESRNLNVADVINYKYLIIVNPEMSIEAISGEKVKSKKDSGQSNVEDTDKVKGKKKEEKTAKKTPTKKKNSSKKKKLKDKEKQVAKS